MYKTIAAGALALAFANSTAARAELPTPVRAMIDAAIATHDPAKVRTVVDIARQTNPADTAEIDDIWSQFMADQKRLADEKAQMHERKLREAGLFDNWNGKGELGATRSTGNTSEIGVSAKLMLERKGLSWRHKLTARVDYLRTDGKTTKEQYLAAYEPNYTIDDGLFAYGLAQFERDRFQGFAGRVSASAGLGYRVIERKDLHLSIKGGPAWRHTRLIDGTGKDAASALAALDFGWRFSKGLRLTQEASAYLESGNSTLTSATGLEAKISSRLAARLSYLVEYESNPPGNAIRTDTSSHVSLVYDF